MGIISRQYSLVRKTFILVVLAFLAYGSILVHAVEPKEGVFVVNNFKFHTGETLPQLNIGYTTLGDPSNEAVLILHGTARSGTGMLNKNFGGELFGPGQPLDAEKYYIILPDSIGTGRSSKPSDGLKANFPKYNYDDMVNAQYKLLTEGLGVKHLRVIIGHSMGGMQTWLWGIKYPDYMDAIVPMASTPMPMSGRNWIMRKFISETVRRDPAWKNGDYTEQPESAKYINVLFGFATNGGSQALQRLAPDSIAGDALVTKRLDAPFTLDTNDFLYQWESSADFNPKGYENIKAAVLAINSADDERNPIALGVMEPSIKRIKNARFYLIPASDQTTGHGTTGYAKWWKKEFVSFINEVPKKNK